MCGYILRFLNTGVFDQRIDETQTVHIPKVKDSHCAKDFRQISLCNVLMSIITKVLANRVKDYMFVIISEEQSVFAGKINF